MIALNVTVIYLKCSLYLYRVHARCAAVKMGNLSNMRHADCLLAKAKCMYTCGPPLFCHDCLSVTAHYEQKTAVEEAEKYLCPGSGCSTIGNVSTEQLRFFNSETDSGMINHEVEAKNFPLNLFFSNMKNVLGLECDYSKTITSDR